jgi:DNA mismatch repair protein MutL
VQEWIDDLLAELHEAAPRLKEKRQNTIAASLAKTAAGHSSEALNPEEAQALIDTLFACENPTICPSGKPVTHIIPLEELDKKLLKN